MKLPNASRAHQRQRGVALIVALVILLITSVVGVVTMRSATLEQRMTTNAVHSGAVFQAAESATDIVVSNPENINIAWNAKGTEIPVNTAFNDKQSGIDTNATIRFIGLGINIGGTTNSDSVLVRIDGFANSDELRASAHIEAGAEHYAP